MEFHDTPDALMVLKSYRSDTSKAERAIIERDINKFRVDISVDAVGNNSNAPMLFIGDLLSNDQMQSLYKGADVFALTSRGEGFSLPTAEAIMAGTPVIVPDAGGHIDFVDPENSYLVKGNWEPCQQMNAFYSCDMEWYEPLVSSTRKALRAAYNDWKANKLALRGEMAKAYIKNNGFDYQSIGEKFYEILEKVNGQN